MFWISRIQYGRKFKVEKIAVTIDHMKTHITYYIKNAFNCESTCTDS